MDVTHSWAKSVPCWIIIHLNGRYSIGKFCKCEEKGGLRKHQVFQGQFIAAIIFFLFFFPLLLISWHENDRLVKGKGDNYISAWSFAEIMFSSCYSAGLGFFLGRGFCLPASFQYLIALCMLCCGILQRKTVWLMGASQRSLWREACNPGIRAAFNPLVLIFPDNLYFLQPAKSCPFCINIDLIFI